MAVASNLFAAACLFCSSLLAWDARQQRALVPTAPAEHREPLLRRLFNSPAVETAEYIESVVYVIGGGVVIVVLIWRALHLMLVFASSVLSMLPASLEPAPSSAATSEPLSLSPEEVDLCGELKSYLGKVTVRSYESIFGKHVDTNLETISRVIRGSSRYQVNPTRYLKCCVFLVIAGLNISNVFLQFRRSMPSQLDLMYRLSTRKSWDDYYECKVKHEHSAVAKPCIAHHADWDDTFLVLLVWAELFMILGTLTVSSCCLFRLLWAETESTSAENFQRWKCVASGFEWLEALPSQSAIKFLPRLKTLPMESVQKFKLLKQELTEDDGVYSTGDKVKAASYLAFLFVRMLLFGIAGILALHFKMESMVFLRGRIGNWNQSQWITFLAFSNQVASLVNFNMLRKDALLFFVFTGEDAQMQPKEEKAMHEFNAMMYKRIFHYCGFCRGVIVGLTISNIDLQKILITEHGKNGGMGSSSVSDAEVEVEFARLQEDHNRLKMQMDNHVKILEHKVNKLHSDHIASNKSEAASQGIQSGSRKAVSPSKASFVPEDRGTR